MEIVRNRLLSIFLSFLMLFTMPTLARDNVNALSATGENCPWHLLSAYGVVAILIGIPGMIGSGIAALQSGGNWKVPYCDINSELITQNTYPSCPNCSVNFENNCYNGTNCYASEQVCVNGETSQAVAPLYKLNLGYIWFISFSVLTVIGFGLRGMSHYSYTASHTLPF